MSSAEALSPQLTERVLQRLGYSRAPAPDLATLRQLLARYTRTVPWESASRIVRRAQHEETADCALMGEAFWESHFEHGTGGTCYESNTAFFGLLLRLGYEGYLTINDMGASIGCHSAIVVLFDGRKYLVDVGFPVHVLLPLRLDRPTSADSPFMRYRATPLSDDRYEIWREISSRERIFQLNDKAVDKAEYHAVALHDYRYDGGQFLDKVVIHKVVDEQLWRFNSDERPLCLQQFVDGERRDQMLGDDAAGEVAEKFGIAPGVMAAAMTILGVDGRRSERAT